MRTEEEAMEGGTILAVHPAIPTQTTIKCEHVWGHSGRERVLVHDLTS